VLPLKALLDPMVGEAEMLTIILVAVVTIAASDDTIHFDQSKADAATEIRGIEVQVQECMREGASIILRSGMRSKLFIVNFTVQSCGSVPAIILRKHHCPDKYISEYLRTLASDELNEVLQERQ
jgi:hypothetical protein